mmetsp:Transcript_9680/g.20899  ORF Transcript_9680/g.20899 Transcript_9680/m.20899 type:complete len:99 (-) Transcript_9680:246-542(-)
MSVITFFGRDNRSQIQQGVGNKKRPDEVDIAVLLMWQTQKHFTMSCQATGRCPLLPYPLIVSSRNKIIPICGMEALGASHWAAQDHVPRSDLRPMPSS